MPSGGPKGVHANRNPPADKWVVTLVVLSGDLPEVVNEYTARSSGDVLFVLVYKANVKSVVHSHHIHKIS